MPAVNSQGNEGYAGEALASLSVARSGKGEKEKTRTRPRKHLTSDRQRHPWCRSIAQVYVPALIHGVPRERSRIVIDREPSRRLIDHFISADRLLSLIRSV
jgi:hypothetical protein